MANDFAIRGLRPCDPPRTKSKPFYEGKTEESSALPLVGTEGLRLRAGLWKRLAQTGNERVKLTHVLGAACWPVLKWPRMAGFEVATEVHQYFEEINAAPVVFRWKYKMDEVVIV